MKATADADHKVECFRFMLCETRVEDRGWEIESKIQFTSDGLVNTVTSKRDNVMMRVHYKYDVKEDVLIW